MYDDLAPELVQRLLGASYALPIPEKLREVADEVYDMDADGRTDKEIDAHIVKWMNANGFGYKEWVAELEQEMRGSLFEGIIDTQKTWRAFGLEEWFKECIRSIAFTDEPIPFFPLAAGYWLPMPNLDPPMLVAVMTPLSDPKLAAKQLIEYHRKLFGDKATTNPRVDEVFNARMLARHRAGMSYRDIAIQNLRGRHPDIVRNPRKYQAELDTERERVVKAIRTAQELWNARGLGDSTA